MKHLTIGILVNLPLIFIDQNNMSWEAYSLMDISFEESEQPNNK